MTLLFKFLVGPSAEEYEKGQVASVLDFLGFTSSGSTESKLEKQKIESDIFRANDYSNFVKLNLDSAVSEFQKILEPYTKYSYIKLSLRGNKSGHAMAITTSNVPCNRLDKPLKFFDPNLGEYKFEKMEDLAEFVAQLNCIYYADDKFDKCVINVVSKKPADLSVPESSRAESAKVEGSSDSTNQPSAHWSLCCLRPQRSPCCPRDKRSKENDVVIWRLQFYH